MQTAPDWRDSPRFRQFPWLKAGFVKRCDLVPPRRIDGEAVSKPPAGIHEREQCRKPLTQDTGLEPIMKSAGFAFLLLLAIPSHISVPCSDDLFAQADFVGVGG
jgi:hypothetical protein